MVLLVSLVVRELLLCYLERRNGKNESANMFQQQQHTSEHLSSLFVLRKKRVAHML